MFHAGYMYVPVYLAISICHNENANSNAELINLMEFVPGWNLQEIFIYGGAALFVAGWNSGILCSVSPFQLFCNKIFQKMEF